MVVPRSRNRLLFCNGGRFVARVKVFEYEELPPEMRTLADTYKAKDGSWDHIRALAHRPEMYEAYYKFLYPLHTAGVVEVPL
jgi:hypothetical protein